MLVWFSLKVVFAGMVLLKGGIWKRTWGINFALETKTKGPFKPTPFQNSSAGQVSLMKTVLTLSKLISQRFAVCHQIHRSSGVA